MVSLMLRRDPTYLKTSFKGKKEMSGSRLSEGFSLRRENPAYFKNSDLTLSLKRESHSVNSPSLPFLAQARQLSLKRESSSIAQDFTLPGDPFSLKRESLAQIFKEVVMYVDPENIVHIVTENAANYVAAGRLLEKEFPHFFWSPCAAHCVNLVFQDIGKLPEVTDIVSHAANITKYLYNHCHPLYPMRQFTNRKEILRPAPTRFATNFIALQSILAQKYALRALVTSREWTSSAYSKDVKAKKCVERVGFKLLEIMC
ncbi:hypothetical protein Lal_00036514 [Lupinus albus]|nr:hypothetical protein Lal_00036514 [Lupinus albus]